MLASVLLKPVIAIPAAALTSTSAIEPAANLPTVITSLVSERTVDGSLIREASVQLGASFSALTMIEAVLLAPAEKALLPPTTEALTR